MVEASLVVSIVLAVISLLGTLVIAVINHISSRDLAAKQHETEKELAVRQADLTQRLEKAREDREETTKLDHLATQYSQPLMVAAYELEERLYELLEYPISKQHLETVEGREDIKIFTCYRIAQYLAWTNILKSKTQYFSFSSDPNLRKIGDLIFRLDDEFDRRRDNNGQNIGVWPGSRILVSERMLKTASSLERQLPLDYDDFRRDWETRFRSPMGYFCQLIDDLIAGRKKRIEHWDDALRAMQHLLVDMIVALDKYRLLHELQRCSDPNECDCTSCYRGKQSDLLKKRGKSRHFDKGLRAGHNHENVDRVYDSSISLEAVQEMTCTDCYDQGARM